MPVLCIRLQHPIQSSIALRRTSDFEHRIVAIVLGQRHVVTRHKAAAPQTQREGQAGRRDLCSMRRSADPSTAQGSEDAVKSSPSQLLPKDSPW